MSSLRSPAQYPVDIGVIVSALGEPEYVSASFSSQGDDCVYGLTVYYPELGIRFYADLYNQCDIVSHDPETGFSVGPLAPDILVRSIECHQPGTLVESLMAVGWTLQQAEMIADRTQEWPGWGYIQLLEPES